MGKYNHLAAQIRRLRAAVEGWPRRQTLAQPEPDDSYKQTYKAAQWVAHEKHRHHCTLAGTHAHSSGQALCLARPFISRHADNRSRRSKRHADRLRHLETDDFSLQSSQRWRPVVRQTVAPMAQQPSPSTVGTFSICDTTNDVANRSPFFFDYTAQECYASDSGPLLNMEVLADMEGDGNSPTEITALEDYPASLATQATHATSAGTAAIHAVDLEVPSSPPARFTCEAAGSMQSAALAAVVPARDAPACALAPGHAARGSADNATPARAAIAVAIAPNAKLAPDMQEKLRRAIFAIYEKAKPDKLKEVPSMLKRYEGEEVILYLRVCRKYNIDADRSLVLGTLQYTNWLLGKTAKE